jgi:hypothetical protein
MHKMLWNRPIELGLTGGDVRVVNGPSDALACLAGQWPHRAAPAARQYAVGGLLTRLAGCSFSRSRKRTCRLIDRRDAPPASQCSASVYAGTFIVAICLPKTPQ